MNAPISQFLITREIDLTALICINGPGRSDGGAPDGCARLARSGGFDFASAEYSPFHVASMLHGAAVAQWESLETKENMLHINATWKGPSLEAKPLG